MATERPKLTTEQLLQALRDRYCAPAWGFLTEVGDATGTMKRRSADALAMSLWPSRGLEVHGFELKASRSDWKRELENPQKAEAIAKYCDRWWLVVGDELLVQPGELPPLWGLLIPNPRGGLKVKVEAPQLTPQPLSRSFLAAIVRRVHESQASEKEIAEAVRVARQNERDAMDAQFARVDSSRNAQTERLAKQIADFEAASGIRIDEWNAGRLGEAVRLFMAADRKVLSGQLKSTAKWARAAAEHAEEAVKALEAGNG